ncbi:MAG: hypothetical protein KBT62_07400, partial [Sulfitobacter litoralis]|nr:hypothetical protein [Sulfitobacter litoralis]
GKFRARTAAAAASSTGIPRAAFTPHENAQLFLPLLHQIIDFGALAFITARSTSAATGGSFTAGPVPVTAVVTSA